MRHNQLNICASIKRELGPGFIFIPHMTDTDAINATSRSLRQAWGLDFGRVRALIARLDAWHTHDELVDGTGLSHRSVGQVLHALDTWLEKDGDRLRLAAADLAAFRTASAPHIKPHPPHIARQRLAALLADRPAPDLDLDHVAATAETLLKRAQHIAATYDLTGAQILCLGDHDLTSLALACLLPDLRIAVADLDERLLAFIDHSAHAHKLDITTHFADFRLELPPSLDSSCDLVFTDPPYSPDGIKLFLQRGIAALKDHPYVRLLLAYGFSEQHPGLGYKVQSALHDLRLTSESILPDFNRYDGARAIGARSALYTLRPTRRSRPAAVAKMGAPHSGAARIYTHGRSAEEAQATVPVKSTEAIPGEWPARATLLVGEWPQEKQATAKRLALASYLTASRTDGPLRVQHLALQLAPHYDAYLPRLLLASQAQTVLAIVDQRHATELTGPLLALIECKYRLISRTNKQHIAWILCEKQPTPYEDAPRFVLRHIADRPKARLANAWREGLIAWHKKQGTTLTKNQARALISQTRIGALCGQHYLTELPLHSLADLIAAAKATIAD